MSEHDDRGLFERIGAILNAPLPGTRPQSGASAPAPDADDETGLLERVKEILSAPLPGSVQAGSGGGSEIGIGTAPAAPGGAPPAATAPTESGQAPTAQTPEVDEDDLDEPWWQQDWAAFRAHRERERSGLARKQEADLEKFRAYQAEEQRRLDEHHRQALLQFSQQQQWRLDAWRQAVAANPGQKPPPPPFPPPGPPGMPPAPGMMPPGAPPPWMRPPGRRR